MQVNRLHHNTLTRGLFVSHTQVIHLPPPKIEREHYRGVSITYTYNPATKGWGYLFTHTQSFEVEDTAKSLDAVKKKAHKKVDHLQGDAS